MDQCCQTEGRAPVRERASSAKGPGWNGETAAGPRPGARKPSTAMVVSPGMVLANWPDVILRELQVPKDLPDDTPPLDPWLRSQLDWILAPLRMARRRGPRAAPPGCVILIT